MNIPAPYLTLWQVAKNWAEELNCDVMEVIQHLRVNATYDVANEPNSSPPPLLIWPTACFSPQGKVNNVSVFNATRLVKKEQSEVVSTPHQSNYRAKYFTEEYKAALAFLNSAECPPKPTEGIMAHLSMFAICRDNFETWCHNQKIQLPLFWFPSNDACLQAIRTAVEKKYNLPNRKGMKIPINKRRKPADFTRVIDSLFYQLFDEGNHEILQPRQLQAFIKCLKKRVTDDAKMKDTSTTYAELINEVIISDPDECLLMVKPRAVKGSNGPIDKYYTRKDIGKRLSELRNSHPEYFSRLTSK